MEKKIPQTINRIKAMTQKIKDRINLTSTLVSTLLIGITLAFVTRAELSRADGIKTKQQVEDVVNQINVFREDQAILRKEVQGKTPLEMTISVKKDIIERLDRQDVKIDKIIDILLKKK